MPASYTHHCLAREAYLSSPDEIQAIIRPDLPLYFFGAQGADFCFFYRSWNPKAKNLGSYLHREGGFPTLQLLKALSSRDRQIFAYTLGYLTHYAADATLHPYIYATAGSSVLRHTRLENILDIRLKKRTSSQEYDEYFRKRLTLEEQDLLFLIYTAVAVKNGFPSPKKPAFLRALSAFNAYLPLPNALFDGVNAKVRSLAANEEKRLWSYPADPTRTSDESVDELFEKAKDFAITLLKTFSHAVKNKLPLDGTLFGKGFLTGV